MPGGGRYRESLGVEKAAARAGTREKISTRRCSDDAEYWKNWEENQIAIRVVSEKLKNG